MLQFSRVFQQARTGLLRKPLVNARPAFLLMVG